MGLPLDIFIPRRSAMPLMGLLLARSRARRGLGSIAVDDVSLQESYHDVSCLVWHALASMFLL